jgi:hypothetical protein
VAGDNALETWRVGYELDSQLPKSFNLGTSKEASPIRSLVRSKLTKPQSQFSARVKSPTKLYSTLLLAHASLLVVQLILQLLKFVGQSRWILVVF